jgi:hypothetical protein
MNTQFLGIPVIFIIAIFIALLVFVWKHKPKQKEFKKKELEKEVKKDNELEYNTLGFNLPKKYLCYGYNRIGWVLSYLPYNQLPKMVLKRKFRSKLMIASEEAEKNIPKERIIGLKVCKPNKLYRALAKFNIGIKYYLVDERYLTQTPQEIIINPSASHSIYLNVVIFSTKAKDIIENIAYRISRTEELEELINFLPKQTYLETGVSGLMAKMREKATIEKEKYKGQIESAEEG